jgi:5-methylcytosine-specific restriction endonuclease McrA
LEKICKFCGNKFKTLNPRQIYCSSTCQIKNQNRNNKNRKRFSGKRYDVLERDNRECLHCGTTKNLVIHHCDETGQTENINNNDNNLITVCRSCHIKFYHLKKQLIGKIQNSELSILRDRIYNYPRQNRNWTWQVL